MHDSFFTRALVAATFLLLVACSGGESHQGSCDPLELDAAGMESAVFEMLSIADTVDRHRRAIALADALNRENLPGAIAALDVHIDKVDPHEVRILAHAWADLDPKGALDHILEGWRYPRVTNEAVEEIVYVWAGSGDGEAARAYVDPSFEGPIPAPRSPTKFMQLAVLKALGVAQDWDNLTGLFSSIEDAGDREFWITRVLVEMNRVHGFAPIRAWTESIPWDAPNNLKYSVLKRALDWRSRLSYAESQAWYEEIERERSRPSLLEPVVSAQGLREPANAIFWLAERAESDERDKLIREIMAGWLSRSDLEEREEARAWALEHSEDEFLRARIAPIMVRSYMGSNEPEKAADYALQYPEAAHADRNLPIVLVRWASLDADAVDAYIEEKQLSQEIVDGYQRELERRIEDGVQVIRTRVKPRAGGDGDGDGGGVQ